MYPEASPSEDRVGVDRRTILKAAAWSAPVVALTVAAPLAAASTELPALTFEITSLVDVDAPYGTQSLRIINPAPVAFNGPLTFRMPVMSVAAPFELPGAVRTRDGDEDIWTIPSITVPAGETTMLNLTWPGPFPLAAEEQRLTVKTDPTRGVITPTGATLVTSPYQYLWVAITPGGNGTPGGTQSFFIGNTTETGFNTPVSPRLPVWTWPQQVAVPLSVDGKRYPGNRALEDNTYVAAYPSIPVNAEARTGKEVFTLLWGASDINAAAQQHRALLSVAGLPILGDPLIHSRYRLT
jgi:hypothetical protein